MSSHPFDDTFKEEVPPYKDVKEEVTSNTSKDEESCRNKELVHMEIKGPAIAGSPPSKAKEISEWIASKFASPKAEDEEAEDVSDQFEDELASFVPLNQRTNKNPMARRQRRFQQVKLQKNRTFEADSDEEDREESSSPTNAGIEVEIDSTCSNDDCLYRKRYLNTIWFWHKNVIILGCSFLFVFLFGIMVGACGTGQCSANRGNSAAAASTSTSASCVGVGDSSTPTTTTTTPSTPSKDYTNNVPVTYTTPTFLGPNAIVFDPSMDTADIQAQADAIFNQQQNNEMGEERYSILFQPGTYGSATEPLMIQIGYYTEVSGLGASPEDVKIVGKIEVYNRCFDPDPYQDGKFIPTDNSEEGLCFALNSFWRGLSNLSIQITKPSYQDDCRATAMFWAISQASSMRRVHIEGGDVSLMDYCSNPAYASGGFIADSHIGGKVISGSQQQFFTRDSYVGEWDGGVWNVVLMGVTNAPNDDIFPDPAITTFVATPANREKPFLFVDDAGKYHVFVPSFQRDTSGTSWSDGGTPGRAVPITDFFVAKPSDPVSIINKELSSGKHLLLTPGVYNVGETILVDRADTVVLGLGIATLTAVDGAVPMKVASQPGIIVAGISIDGGLTLSPVLLQIGDLGDALTDNGDPDNPITLSDVYFRIGGPHISKANVCLEINSNHVLVDHTWVWRADHGVEDFDTNDGFEGDNERWVTNIGLNGVVVNGNDVTATGLFVEHFQEYNTIWNGERGKVYFYQNELPYEPPSQEEWTADDGTLGWAAFKVNDSVMEHELWNGGVYCYNRNNPDVVTTNAFEVPDRAGVTLNRILTRNLSGPGTIQHIVNGIGRSVTEAEPGPFYVIKYGGE